MGWLTEGFLFRDGWRALSCNATSLDEQRTLRLDGASHQMHASFTAALL